MGRIQVVTAGIAADRAIFEQEGRGHWSRALPLALEKYGLLDVEEVGPAVLDGLADAAPDRILLVARLPESAWTRERMAAVRRSAVPIILESPIPERLERALGITGDAADPEGALAITDRALHEASRRWCGVAGGRVAGPSTRPVPLDDAQQWPNLPVPIAAEQAAAWRRPGWDARRWAVAEGTRVLATWTPPGEGETPLPALVRRRSLMMFSFGVFAYLGQQHTVAPFDGPEYLSWPRALGVEGMLLGLIDELCARFGLPRARVAPWPAGATWAFGVRHDVDRPIDAAGAAEGIAMHARSGTAATWYWRASRLEGREGKGSAAAAQALAGADGHEVAHHTERPWPRGELERDLIASAAGAAVQGSCAHGDQTCFRWQGAPNLLFAERVGYAYTEFISHAHLVPHGFAALGADGAVRLSDLVCLPHHESFDRSSTDGDHYEDHLPRGVELHRARGGYLQLLNHPDINRAPLEAALGAVPRNGRLDWTAAQVADWWRRTHRRAALTLRHEADGGVSVTATEAVEGLVLELRTPAGLEFTSTLDLQPGRTVQVTAAGDVRPERRATAAAEEPAPEGAGAPPAPRPEPAGEAEPEPGPAGGGVLVAAGPWADGPAATDVAVRADARWERDLTPAYAQVVRAYYARMGTDPDGPAATSTVRTNTELVPERAQGLIAYLEGLAGEGGLAGRDVIDVGSGFGAMATYIALRWAPASLTAVEVREDILGVARDVAEREQVAGLRFVQSDMRTLEGLDDDSADVALVNNALLYVTSKRDVARSLENIARVLRPGGRILVFQAHRWRLREPFTQDPIVHLLSPRLAGGVSRVTGWQHSHGRVRLVSPPALRRAVRRAGFTDVTAGVMRGGALRTGRRAWASGYVAVGGHLPGEPSGSSG